jgi:hypothetical protein
VPIDAFTVLAEPTRRRIHSLEAVLVDDIDERARTASPLCDPVAIAAEAFGHLGPENVSGWSGSESRRRDGIDRFTDLVDRHGEIRRHGSDGLSRTEPRGHNRQRGAARHEQRIS